MSTRTCGTPGCGRPHRARGYCGSCYNRNFPNPSPQATVRCAVCGTMVAKDKRDHGKRKPVCGYRCRAFLQWGKWPDGQIPPSRRTMAETRLAYRPERSRQRWYAGACRGCGKQFISATIQDRWCSVECGARQAHEKRRARLRDAFVEPVNRMAIFERDRWRCQLCHRKVDKRLKHPHLMSATLDHIVPLAKGGKHEAVNVQLAHLHCNVAKRDNAANDQLLLFG